MKALQLLYAKNVIFKKGETAQQELEFVILVRNIAYQKQVEVFWAGQEGFWRTMKMAKIWKAEINYGQI